MSYNLLECQLSRNCLNIITMTEHKLCGHCVQMDANETLPAK